MSTDARGAVKALERRDWMSLVEAWRTQERKAGKERKGRSRFRAAQKGEAWTTIEVPEGWRETEGGPGQAGWGPRAQDERSVGDIVRELVEDFLKLGRVDRFALHQAVGDGFQRVSAALDDLAGEGEAVVEDPADL